MENKVIEQQLYYLDVKAAVLNAQEKRLDRRERILTHSWYLYIAISVLPIILILFSGGECQ